jgi:hypothetical protein
MKRNLPPRIAALLIALALAGSAGAATAATSAPSSSWFGAMEQMVMACVSGNPTACMAASGESGVVTPDRAGDPRIHNQ